jgi:hypothetical protein
VTRTHSVILFDNGRRGTRRNEASAKGEAKHKRIECEVHAGMDERQYRYQQFTVEGNSKPRTCCGSAMDVYETKSNPERILAVVFLAVHRLRMASKLVSRLDLKLP